MTIGMFNRVPSLIKINKNRRFEYRPRYYDESKERIKNLNQENENRLTKEDFRHRWEYNRRTVSKQSKNSIIRFVIIIGILLVLAYVILNANMTLIDSLLKK